MTSLAERAAQLSPQAREVLARELIRAGTVFPLHALAEPIAVVGIGCRFPGNVTGPESFWRLLGDGGDAIEEVPADRWDADAFYDPDPSAPGRMTTKWGGFVSDVAGFDAEFFGITPREAEAMDPQQRMLLEVSWEALEHAGIAPDRLSGSRTGVMVGMSSWDYTIVNIEHRAEIDAYLSTGNPHSAAVGRIAYLLGLRGPAVAVDTACSSSLVAVHLACQSLRMRDSDLALAGGVQLSLSPFTGIALSKWSALSPQGRCKTFDAGADGFVRGEGCGVVVLKRLADAQRDGDRVLAVVRGSAINQDGRSNGMTAPNAMAQRDVITDALKAGDIAADTVHYVEAHGTGTVLGDPIEFEALAATYGTGPSPCALGAVKTNLGHLEAAAGVAGFIKAVMVVGHETIPPNLHFTRWNPAIDPASTRFYVPSENTPWPADAGLRRAGVSSFGLGGTNAHVVVEQAPDAAPTPSAQPAVTTLVLSGKTPQRVSAWASALADWLEGAGASTPLPDVVHTLRHHRARHATVGTVAAADRVHAVAGLRALAAGRPAAGVVLPHESTSGRGTVFAYSGQGSQWAGMGRQLMADEPAFAAAVAELEPVFVEQTGFSLHAVLTNGEPVSGIDRIQPVLVGVQLALTALWRAHGVEPDAVIGHSMGEVTAAVVAGALTAAEGLRVIATRSRLMARLAGQGAMALLELDADGAEALIADYPQLTVAVHASPRQTVIAGPPEQIDTLVAVVEHTGRLARRVDVDVASHNPIIEPVLPELLAALADLAPATPAIPVITTTYDHTGPAATFDADYWAANLRKPVRFTQAVASAATHHSTFIEMSPHPLLTHAITDTLESAAPTRRARVTSAMNRDEHQTLFFHSQLAAIKPWGGADGRVVDVPNAPWQHTPFWVADRSGVGDLSSSHPLLGVHMELPSGRDHIWQADVGTDVCPWLADHKVHGQPILPAAAFAEIALAAGSEALGLPAHAVSVMRLEVEQMLPLHGHTRITTQLSGNPDGSARVEIHSRSRNGWTRHAVAKIEPVQMNSPAPTCASTATGGVEVAPTDFYATLRQTGQHHGPAFAALTRVVRHTAGGSDTEITVPAEASRHPGFRVHPVMLDAALQSMAAAMPDRTVAQAAEISYLPVSFETIRVFGEVGRHARCHAEVVDLDEAGAGKLGSVTLTDDAGNVLAELTGVYVRRVERRAIPLPLEQKIFDTAWVQTPPADEAAAASGSWLVLADSQTAVEAKEFAALWSSAGRRVISADLTDESGVRAAFAETGADAERPPAGVVLFIGSAPSDLAEAVTRARDSVWAIASAVRTIVGGWHGRSPRLWLVTRRALAVNGDGPGDPGAASLRGLIRVLAYEHSDLRATMVDLEDDPAATLATELESAHSDDIIAWRSGRRYAERLARAELGVSQHRPVVRTDAAYIVTGGLGGLGMVVARWLVDNGAGRVVLNGRSKPSDDQRKILAELEAVAEIAVVEGDIASSAVAEQLVAAAEETGRELRGIVHGAAVIDDSLLIAMTRESLERVWAPKAIGAVRLHEASVGRALDWWTGFSSVASLLGSPGQGAYAAASAWLDGLMTWRASSGLPATGINWGPWSEVGVARLLTGSVLDPITPAEGIEALDTLLGTERTLTGVARLRADRALAAFPEIRGLAYFSSVVEELDAADDGGDWAGVDSLRGIDPVEAQRIITDRLCARIAAIMGYADPAAVETTQPLTEMGLDSLMAVRIRNTARADFGVEPPVALLLQGATLADVATDLVRQLGLAEPNDGRQVDEVRDRAQQRAAARQEAGLRRNRGQRV